MYIHTGCVDDESECKEEDEENGKSWKFHIRMMLLCLAWWCWWLVLSSLKDWKLVDLSEMVSLTEQNLKFAYA